MEKRIGETGVTDYRLAQAIFGKKDTAKPILG